MTGADVRLDLPRSESHYWFVAIGIIASWVIVYLVIIVGFLLKRLPRRAQVALAVFGQIVMVLFCALLVVTGLELAPSQLVFYTYILNIPRFYSTLPLIVASASMTLTAVYYAIVAWQSRHVSVGEIDAFEHRNLIVEAPEVVI